MRKNPRKKVMKKMKRKEAPSNTRVVSQTKATTHLRLPILKLTLQCPMETSSKFTTQLLQLPPFSNSFPQQQIPKNGRETMTA